MDKWIKSLKAKNPESVSTNPTFSYRDQKKRKHVMVVWFIQHNKTFQIYDKLNQTSYTQPVKRGLEIRRLDAGAVVGQSTAEGTEGSKT